jgi:hypothetical protein
MLADVAPLLHRYVDAPVAVNVTEAPAQIEDADTLTATEGTTLTVMV